MSFYTKANFAATTIDGNITNSATSLSVASGAGAKFPSSGTFVCVIWHSTFASPDLDSNAEIIEVTARSTDAFTIVRGREGTSGHAWSTGDRIACNDTAGTWTQLYTVWDVTSEASDYSMSVGETVKVTYSADTSVPLNVATTAGKYEMTIIGKGNTVPGDWGAPTLQPNNTTVTDAFAYAYYGNVTPGTGVTNCFVVASGYVIESFSHISTITVSKGVLSHFIGRGPDDSLLVQNFHTAWEDESTEWTSLGTLVFPTAQSGTVFIRRVA
jgi:hypothetical protein